MRLETTVLFAVLALGCFAAAFALAGNSPAYDRTDPTDDDIRALIQRLGSAAFKEREAAKRSLLVIGDATIPYLRRATCADRLEIATRARRLLSLLEARDDDWRRAVRSAADAAFRDGRYEQMAACYRQLAALDPPEYDDCLWLGHTYQLASRWAESVAAYHHALAVLTGTLRAAAASRAPGDNEESAGSLERRIRTRAALILLVGKIERDELRDPRAAAKTFAKGIDFSPALNRPLVDLASELGSRLGQPNLPWKTPEHYKRHRRIARSLTYPLLALQELALTQERLAEPREALATWSRVNLASLLYDTAPPDIRAVARLTQSLPRDTAVAATAPAILLTPQHPVCTLRLDAAATLVRSYGWDKGWRRFAICPPRGQEFATLEFVCDVEQHHVRRGGQLTCSTIGERDPRDRIGSVAWPKGKPPGRDVCTKRLPIPVGTRAVEIRTGQWDEHFTVHQVEVRATFRRRDAAAQSPPHPVRLQTEVLPEGGTLTMNGCPIRANCAIDDLAPGRYAFAYEVRGCNTRYRAEHDLTRGGRLGLFVNLHSPFRWHLTGLRDLNRHPPARSSIVQLPDGGWLTAFCAHGSKIMLSTSDDLVTWQESWPLAVDSVFDNIAPALIVDDAGTIWLAYFSNRLHLETTSSAGYRLWIASSPDGRTWSRPRLVSGDEPHGGWPMGNIQFLRDPSGKYRLFWRRFAASADSPGQIATLRPIAMDLPPRVRLSNPHVSAGPDGFHMVFDDFGNGIYYSRSSDGWNWAPPVLAVPLGRHSKVSHGQLIRAGRRIALVYEGLNGAWLRRGSLGPSPELGSELKITNYFAPLNGARIYVTPDGKAVGLAGLDRVWALQAAVVDLVDSPPGP